MYCLVFLGKGDVTNVLLDKFKFSLWVLAVIGLAC